MKHLRQWMKKALAYTLTVTLLVPMLAGLTPMQVNAEQNPESNLILDENTESLAVEGTNSIGSLLAEEINASNGGQSNGEGYSIFGLTMENNVATVEYAVLEDCTLLVSIYDETTGQMAGSGTAAISADYYSAEVTVEAPVMPEYFIVKAYMVDSTNMKPLRSVYENTMYTKDMQELMKATVDDFDPERVLNLDADKTTNFLVYGEDTIRITADAGTNVVTSQGADSDTYTVENITEDIKALKAGDIVAIGSGADVTIVKIKKITIEGTKATIVEDDVELEEIFECIKIENESDSKDAVIDESTGGEGVTYNGKVEEQPEVLTADEEEKGKFEASPTLNAEFTYSKDEGGKLSVLGGAKFELDLVKSDKAKIGGDVSVGLTAKLKFYLTKKKQYIEFASGFTLAGNIEISGSWDFMKIELKPFKLPTLLAGLTINIKPTFIIKVTGSVKFSFGFFGKDALVYDSQSNPCVRMEDNAELETLEISGDVIVDIGLQLEPDITMLHEKVASLGAKGEAMFEIKGTVGKNFKEVHTCVACAELSIGVKVTLEPEIMIANWLVPIEGKLEIDVIKGKVGYFSVTHKEFGWGECPYKEKGLYHAEIIAKDKKGYTLSGVKIKITGTYDNGQPFEMAPCTTDAGGKASIIIPKGKNIKIVGSKENYRDSSRTIPKWTGEQRISDLTLYDYSEIYGYPIILKEGVTLTGNEYKNAYIKKLVIEDDAYITNGSVFNGAVIEEVVIKEQVTKIPDELFKFSTINNIELPQNVTNIGNRAFSYAKLPEGFQLGSGVKTVGANAFYGSGVKLYTVAIDKESNFATCAFSGCAIKNLELRSDDKVTINDAFMGASIDEVVISKNVTKIPDNMFKSSTINNIDIPDNVVEIGEDAFYLAKLPKGFQIGKGVKIIGQSAFAGSGINPEKIIIDEETNIMGYAFSQGKIKEVELKSDKGTFKNSFEGAIIEKVTISADVTNIPDYLFSFCTIQKLEMPDNVTSIGKHAFSSAKLPKSFQIGKGVKTIGDWAFAESGINPEKIVIDEEMNIMEYAFSGITIKEVELKSDKGPSSKSFQGATIEKVTISESVTDISNNLFSFCTIQEIEIPENVTTIGNYAFNGTKLPEEFQIGDGVKTIGEYAFNGTGIYPEKIVIDEDSNIMSNAFYGITIKEVELAADNSGNNHSFQSATIEKLTISEGVTAIPNYSFYMSTIQEIDIPENVTAIGDYAFWYAKLPEGFQIGKGVKTIGRYAFANTGIKLESIVLDEGSNIVSNAFSGVTIKLVELRSEQVAQENSFGGVTIDKVLISENVTRIPANLFWNSTIHEITIPGNVTAIGNNAFRGATLPESFSISDSVSVGYNAFEGSTYNYIPPTTSNGTEEDEVPAPEQPEDLELPPMEPEEELPTEPEPTEQIPPVTYEEPTPVYQALPTVTQRTAKLTGLRPNDTYNFYSVKANYEFMSMEEIMAPENILYVTQVQTDTNGTATISYLPREEYDSPVEFAKCMSRYDISDVKVQQEDIIYDGTQKENLPVVVYEGQQLAEYADYDVVGDFQVTDKGMYTIYIVGKNDYCGAVKVDFKVYSPDDNPFADVKESGWEYPFVKAAYDNKLMSGKSKDENGLIIFDPGNFMTRAEFVQTLYNKEGKEEVTYTARFTDVPDNQWYTDAILWAAENNIVAGKGDKFDVSGKITREEMATILYKYATNYKGYETAGRAEFTGYTDASSISNWATENMKWALHYGIMKGKKEALAPKDNATRAECATMLSNFMEAYE